MLVILDPEMLVGFLYRIGDPWKLPVIVAGNFILRYAIEIGLLPGRYLVDIIPFRHDFIAALEHQYL